MGFTHKASRTKANCARYVHAGITLAKYGVIGVAIAVCIAGISRACRYARLANTLLYLATGTGQYLANVQR